jgi:hypothetical protein
MPTYRPFESIKPVICIGLNNKIPVGGQVDLNSVVWGKCPEE